MQLQLPKDIQAALDPLLAALPPEKAMPRLVGGQPEAVDVAGRVVKSPALRDTPELQAGVWLYVDEIDLAHTISQGISTPTGSYWHGIVHRREGDFANSHYWFNRMGDHPVVAELDDYEPHTFVDAVAKARPDDAALLDLQRREWAALVSWCAHR